MAFIKRLVKTKSYNNVLRFGIIFVSLQQNLTKNS